MASENPTEPKLSREELMEFYKTYLSSIEVTTNRRQQSNQFFIGLLTALFGVILALIKDGGQLGLETLIFALGGVLGIILSAIWLRYVRSSVMLNKVKFEILEDMENRLGEKPFMTEYQMLKKQGYVGLGKLEARLPWIMIFVFAGLILYSIINAIILLNG